MHDFLQVNPFPKPSSLQLHTSLLSESALKNSKVQQVSNRHPTKIHREPFESDIPALTNRTNANEQTTLAITRTLDFLPIFSSDLKLKIKTGNYKAKGTKL